MKDFLVGCNFLPEVTPQKYCGNVGKNYGRQGFVFLFLEELNFSQISFCRKQFYFLLHRHLYFLLLEGVNLTNLILIQQFQVLLEKSRTLIIIQLSGFSLLSGLLFYLLKLNYCFCREIN